MKESKRIYYRKYLKVRSGKLKAQGICPNCTKRPAAPNRTCCEVCLENKKINTLNRKFAGDKANNPLLKNTYRSLLGMQKNKCAICKSEMKAVNFDHDHATGKARGLLCTSCNTGLGLFKDSPGLLQQAILYIKRYQQ